MQHLTVAEKRQHISEWRDLQDRARDTLSPGSPDPEVFGLVDALNEIQGVCVVQSCSGHRQPERKAEGQAVRKGHLWLRLSGAMYRRFQQQAANLARVPVVDDVSVRFGRGEGPVIEVVFDGKECGRLSRSGAYLVSFFSGLAGVYASASPGCLTRCGSYQRPASRDTHCQTRP